MDTALYCNKEGDGGQPHGCAEAVLTDGTTAELTPTELTPTERTTVKRVAHRASYDRELVHSILDAGLICHIGLATERGPVVIPTIYTRIGERVYIHGSPASRLVRSLKQGVEVCLTVTHVDAMVVARSHFHHSMNYRSVVLFGTATEMADLDERAEALAAFVDRLLPGRAGESRPANDLELRGTLVLSLPIEEASAKVRTGGPIDDPEDLDRPVWAGVVPLVTVAGAPVAAGDGDTGVPVPASVGAFRDRFRADA